MPVKHPYDYYWRPGMPLRPAPAGRQPEEFWLPSKQLIAGHARDLEVGAARSRIGDLVLDHQWQGDEQMDAVVDWFTEVGPPEGRRQLEQALAEGIDSVPNPSAALVSLFDKLDNPPEWYDPELWERGRQVWLTCSMLSKMAMIQVDLAVTILSQPVSSSVGAAGRFANRPVRRYMETLRFFYGVTLPGSMERGAQGYRDAIQVRLMHAQVRRGLRKTWGEENFALNGDPIPNSLLAAVAVGIGLAPLFIDESMGRKFSDEDWQAVLCYWGYIGYVSGGAEEIIPVTREEAFDFADAANSSLGLPSEWSDDMARMFNRQMTELPIAAIGADTPAVVLGPVLALAQLFLGGFRYFLVGEEAARILSLGSPAENANLELWSKLAKLAFRANVAFARVSDLMPTKGLVRGLKAKNGDMYERMAFSAFEGLAERQQIVADFRTHDNSPTQGVAPPPPEPPLVRSPQQATGPS